MSLRDFLIVLLVFVSVPVTLVQPYVGILAWTWVSLMSPHRLTWGFAYSLRIALIVGAVTLIAWLISKERKWPPATAISWWLLAFTAWISFANLFALFPDLAYEKWDQVIKILLMSFVALCLVTTRERVILLVWVTAASIGFYGVRGGVFTVLTGGDFRVYGPDGSFIADNNQLGLAMVMSLPLLYYLAISAAQRWLRVGVWSVLVLTVLATLGTYSRGALLGLSAMIAMMWWRTRYRAVTALLFVLLLGGALTLFPDRWMSRMESIATYAEDSSVQGRFDAWKFATLIALDRPIVGGGFRVFYDADLFRQYVPEAAKDRNAHSIFFEVLGETGFVGLFLFLGLGIAGLLTCGRVIRTTRNQPEFLWATQLAQMARASLLGYAICGAFLNLGFFDLYYTVLVIIAATAYVVRTALVAEAVPSAQRPASYSPAVATRGAAALPS